MADNYKTGKDKKKRKRRTPNLTIYVLVILAIAACFFLYFLYLEKSAVSPPGEEAISHVETAAPPAAPSPLPELSETGETGSKLPGLERAAGNGDSSADEAVADQAADEAQTPAETVRQASEEQNRSCSASLSTIEGFYLHLDRQEYLKPYELGQPADMYFSSLIQKVVDNPPIVTGETDDLFNVLKNTAHFFRVVGKKNIFVLKAILDREKDSFEKVLAEFYKLTYQPECLQKGFSLNISQDALYDYAGFFLNTMGGRLYLFRRDSVSRMAVSYYSILIVDNANSTGTNKHGIDVVPAIEMLIPELENSGSQLRLKDEYLDTLYDLKEKYM